MRRLALLLGLLTNYALAADVWLPLDGCTETRMIAVDRDARTSLVAACGRVARVDNADGHELWRLQDAAIGPVIALGLSADGGEGVISYYGAEGSDGNGQSFHRGIDAAAGAWSSAALRDGDSRIDLKFSPVGERYGFRLGWSRLVVRDFAFPSHAFIDTGVTRWSSVATHTFEWAFTPNGAEVVVAASPIDPLYGQETLLQVFDAQTAKLKRERILPEYLVYTTPMLVDRALAFDPDAKFIALSGVSGEVAIIDFETLTVSAKKRLPVDAARVMDLAHDGVEFVAVATGSDAFAFPLVILGLDSGSKTTVVRGRDAPWPEQNYDRQVRFDPGTRRLIVTEHGGFTSIRTLEN